MPSATILSDTGSWITVDAAISDALFYFDHNPMRLVGVGADAPGGERGHAVPAGRPRRARGNRRDGRCTPGPAGAGPRPELPAAGHHA